MATCANCSAELRPEWNFCVFCGLPTGSTEIDVDNSASASRVNPLAILALVLALIGGFPALIFGHLAMVQIRRNGERGMLIARIATVLGYIWLAAGIVLLFAWLSGAF